VTSVVPAVLPLPVAPILVSPAVVLGAVALPQAERVRLVADDDQTAIFLQQGRHNDKMMHR